MRFSFAIFIVLVASVSGSGLFPRQIPSCAAGCISNANLGGCSATDNACLCRNQAFVNGIAKCLVNSCTGADLTNAVAAAQALCAAAGVTLTGTLPLPSSTGISTSPGATSTSPATTTRSTQTTATATKTSNAALSDSTSGNAAAGLAFLGLALVL